MWVDVIYIGKEHPDELTITMHTTISSASVSNASQVIPFSFSRKYKNPFQSLWENFFTLIDLFHNNFSPCGLQPEHRKLVHEL